MPNFYPGTEHRVRVPVRNSGAAPAAIPDGLGLISIIPDVGGVALALPAVLNPGVQFTAESFFTIPPGAIPGSVNTYALSINYDGQLLHATGPAFTVEAPGPLIIYSTDSWEEFSLWPGQQFRGETISGGYDTVNGTHRAFIVFPALPSFTRVVLKMVIQQVWGAARTNRFRIGTTTIFTDSATAPGPISADITPFVVPGTPFTLVVEPSDLASVVQFYHAYWSHLIPPDYGYGEVRPRLEVI